MEVLAESWFPWDVVPGEKENSQIQVKSAMGISALRHQSIPGAQSRGHLAQGEALLGRTLRPWRTPLCRGSPSSCHWFQAASAAGLISDFCAGKRLICIYAKSDYFVYLCLHDRGRFLRVLRSSLNADFCPKPKSLVLHCEFLQHPALMKVICIPYKPCPRVSIQPWSIPYLHSSILSQGEDALLLLW